MNQKLLDDARVSGFCVVGEVIYADEWNGIVLDKNKLAKFAELQQPKWIACNFELPKLGDYSVLAFFSENDGIDMVHVEDYFKDITAGHDEKGNQAYTKWYMWQKVTHWMPLPSPPINTEG